MADVRSGLDPKDYRYLRTPDPAFSPERNKAVIDETIREAEKWHEIQRKALLDEEGNRADILSSYAKHTLFDGKNKNLREFLGSQRYNELVGEKVLERVRIADSIGKLKKGTL